MCFGELRENAIVRLGKLIGGCTGELDQSFAVAGKFITRFNFVFFVRYEVRRLDFGDLMSKQIEFLFAGGLRCIERGVFGEQCV